MTSGNENKRWFGLMLATISCLTIVGTARADWQDWQQALVDGSTFWDGEIGQVTVADARPDGVQRIYVYGFTDNPNYTYVYELSRNATSWSKTLVGSAGGPAWPVGPVFCVGEGRNDGVKRIYCQAAWFNISEFTYQGGAWTGDFFYEGGYPYEPTVGAGRGDGINRLYCPGWYVVCELTYDSQANEWIYSSLPDSQQSDSVCVAALRSGTKRVYASWAGQVYEYQWDGSDFVRSVNPITSTGSTLQYLVNGDGRNIGTEALYCGAENGHIYEVRWTGAAWQTTDLGEIDNEGIRSIAVGSGRNDGINRVYVGFSQYCYELSFNAGMWSNEMVGAGDRVTLGKARNDGVTRIYAGDIGYLYEYTWVGSINHEPQLTYGSVSPSSGDTDTDFYWYVDYYDQDGDAPSTRNVYIDGTTYMMSLYTGSASNGTYYYGPRKLAADSHNYYFYFTDGQGGSDRLPSSGTYSGPNTDGVTVGGSIVAWGYNNYGQCNVPDGNDFVAIASGGEYYSLALNSDGSLVAWGDNRNGQCNVPAGNDFVSIASGLRHSLALKVDGSLVAWGDNSDGQCNVPSGNDFVAIACGWDYSLALKVDGSLVAWGYNNYGQCNVPSGNDFAAVASGGWYNLALKSDGSIIAWGDNSDGQCNSPSGNDFVAIAGGYWHSLALKSDGSLVAWGWNGTGQCNVPSGNDFADIAGGGYHSLALKSDGSLAAWGRNYYGQCDVPVGNDFVNVAAGSFHSLAIKKAVVISPVYRFWSPVNERHFYTIKEAEKDKLINIYAHVWTYESIAYYAFETDSEPGLVPVYRFWSPVLVAHFYTISESERDKLINIYPHVWTYEGIAFYAYPEGQQPGDAEEVYRFWSPVLETHFYTISETEKNKLIDNYSHVWTYEGIAWYAHELQR